MSSNQHRKLANEQPAQTEEGLELFELFFKDIEEERIHRSNENGELTAEKGTSSSITENENYCFTPVSKESNVLGYPMVFNQSSVGPDGPEGPGGETGLFDVQESSAQSHSPENGTNGKRSRGNQHHRKQPAVRSFQQQSSDVWPKTLAPKSELNGANLPAELRSKANIGRTVRSSTTDSHLLRRRELNRENARKSRERKKVRLDSLVERARQLEAQNIALKEEVKRHGETSHSDENDSKESSSTTRSNHSWKNCTLLLDGSSSHFTIRHVCNNFLKLTGLPPSAVIGKTLDEMSALKVPLSSIGVVTSKLIKGSRSGVPFSFSSECGSSIQCLLTSRPLLTLGAYPSVVVVNVEELPSTSGRRQVQ